MPYGTILFIALILVVACSLLGWLSALLADTAPEAGRKAAQEASNFQLEINSFPPTRRVRDINST